MKKVKILIFVCSLIALDASAQQFNKSINRDSLLRTLIKDMPEVKKNEFIKIYNSGNDKSKEFLLFMYSMPKSSKKELIKNIDTNYNKIYILKAEFTKLVPKRFNVRIEFNPANNIVSTNENIDLMIEESRTDGEQKVAQDWNLAYNSEKLNQMLTSIKWNNETLKTIKKLLKDANCISVENGNITTVGFARSGMGKYSYLIFDTDLTREQIKNYNDGCSDLYYKKNIVLNYAGGAIGPQCFPD